VCALARLNGRLTCWGLDAHEQATPPGESGFLQVAAGASHTCAVAGQRNMRCWGQDTYDQIFPEHDPGPYTHVGSYFRHTCGIEDSTLLTCWGWDFKSILDYPSGSFNRVATGEYHSCAISNDGGALVCWGDDDEGQATPP